jgi:hypothetical protein
VVTPDPLPAGSRLHQDLGFLAFTLDQMESIMPTKKPRGRLLTRVQKAVNRRLVFIKVCRVTWPTDLSPSDGGAYAQR